MCRFKLLQFQKSDIDESDGSVAAWPRPLLDTLGYGVSLQHGSSLNTLLRGSLRPDSPKHAGKTSFLIHWHRENMQTPTQILPDLESNPGLCCCCTAIRADIDLLILSTHRHHQDYLPHVIFFIFILKSRPKSAKLLTFITR